MGRQQFAHGETIVKYERAFLLHFRIRRCAVTATTNCRSAALPRRSDAVVVPPRRLRGWRRSRRRIQHDDACLHGSTTTGPQPIGCPEQPHCIIAEWVDPGSSAAGDTDRGRRLHIPHIAVIPPSTNSSAPVT